MNKKDNLDAIIKRVTNNNKRALKRKGPESKWTCQTCKHSMHYDCTCGYLSGNCVNGCYQPANYKRK